MKRSEIVIGQCYVCKVSGTLVPVKIVRDLGDDPGHSWNNFRSRHKGWEARNVRTGRTVQIRSAARLRRQCDDPDNYVWTPAHEASISAYAAATGMPIDDARKIAQGNKVSVQGIEKSRQRASARAFNRVSPADVRKASNVTTADGSPGRTLRADGSIT